MVDRERGGRASQGESADDDVVLGRAVRRLREARRLSEEALAGRLAVSVTFVSRVERGERGTRWRSVRKMLRALEATPGELAAAIAVEEGGPRQG